MVRQSRRAQDRVTLLPHTVPGRRIGQVDRVAAPRERDLARHLGEVDLPGARARTPPGASRDLAWQHLFPATGPCLDPATGRQVRHHIRETAVQKAVKAGARQARLRCRVTCHTLRHSFATHLLQGGTDIRIIQALLGHKVVRTTMIYTHLAHSGPLGVISPLDRAPGQTAPA